MPLRTVFANPVTNSIRFLTFNSFLVWLAAIKNNYNYYTETTDLALMNSIAASRSLIAIIGNIGPNICNEHTLYMW